MNDELKQGKKPTSLRNWLTVTGAIISLGGLFAFAFLFFIDVFAHHGNPYMGILAYVISPAFVILGVLLSLVGAWRQHRKVKKGQPVYEISIDLTRPRDRKIATGFTIGAALFLMVTALGSISFMVPKLRSTPANSGGPEGIVKRLPTVWT